MTRVLIVAAVAVVAALVALALQRRRPAPPTNPATFEAPAQLDRADFERPDAPWLVVVFSSATCDACAGVLERATLLRSGEVAVVDVEVSAAGDLHRRYHIDAVPTTVVADAAGVVRRSFIGPVTSTHLWGALAGLRAPGSVPDTCAAEGDQAGASPGPDGHT